MTDSERSILLESGIIIERTRYIRSPQVGILFKAAAKNVYDIFASPTDLRSIMEFELAYLEIERDFCHSDAKKMFSNTINAYNNALNILKIITEEPEMYIKYCVPACVIMKRKGKRGVPHDAFHYALALHKMRFECDCLPHFSREDRDILNLRLKNIYTAWKLYVELQREVLNEFATANKINEGFKQIEEGQFLEHDQVKANFEAKYGGM